MTDKLTPETLAEFEALNAAWLAYLETNGFSSKYSDERYALSVALVTNATELLKLARLGLAATAGPWVAVSERMPAQSGQYLAADTEEDENGISRGCFVAIYYAENHGPTIGFYAADGLVVPTHWAELRAPGATP